MNYYNKLDITKALNNRQKCLDLIEDRFGYYGDITTGGFYILPDGTAIKAKDHGDIDLYLIKKGYITNLTPDSFDYSDGSQFMDALNCLRLRRRGGADAWIIPYVLIPEKSPTQTQYNVLFDWLKFVLDKNGVVIVEAQEAFNGLSKTFKKSSGAFAEDIIDSIKTYYRAGILEDCEYDNLFDDEIDDTDYELEAGLRKGFFDQFEN